MASVVTGGQRRSCRAVAGWIGKAGLGGVRQFRIWDTFVIAVTKSMTLAAGICHTLKPFFADPSGGLLIHARTAWKRETGWQKDTLGIWAEPVPCPYVQNKHTLES